MHTQEEEAYPAQHTFSYFAVSIFPRYLQNCLYFRNAATSGYVFFFTQDWQMVNVVQSCQKYSDLFENLLLHAY